MYSLNTMLTDAVRCFMDTVEDEEEADTDSSRGPWGAAEGGSPAGVPAGVRSGGQWCTRVGAIRARSVRATRQLLC